MNLATKCKQLRWVVCFGFEFWFVLIFWDQLAVVNLAPQLTGSVMQYLSPINGLKVIYASLLLDGTNHFTHCIIFWKVEKSCTDPLVILLAFWSIMILEKSYTAQKVTIHQVTTMLATYKIVLFPGHNHLLTTGTDDPTLWLSPKHREWKIISTSG